MTVKTFFPETFQCIGKTENQGKYSHADMDKGMKEMPVKWYINTADRFLSLLRDHTWNQAVTLLKAEKEEREGKTA